VKVQRKISRKAGYRGATVGYFDLDYLKRISKVTAKIRGLDPDNPNKSLKFDGISIPKPIIKHKKMDAHRIQRQREILSKARAIRGTLGLKITKEKTL
jgi:hypothetical protein